MIGRSLLAMVVSQGMRRLMGRRRAFPSKFQTNKNIYNTATISTNHATCFSTFGCLTAKERCDFEKDKRIEKGDFVDLSTLLFTANRDYLIKYNHPQLVTAEQLAGKVIGIYFQPLHSPPPHDDNGHSIALVATYNDLKANNCFEVVLVVVDDDVTSEPGKICFNPSLQGKFQDIYSHTPSWLAIPFSDITSRQCLKRKFGFFSRYPQVVLIDSAGMVLDTSPRNLFQTYGSEAYPFSDERISFLKDRDKTAFSQPSLKALLGSSERDFVISNKGYKVPISTLENKVVALFFYEDGYSPDFFTRKLKMYYEGLRKNNENFEVVLLYLYDTDLTINSTNEETFWKTFNTMPWLALPYKDLALKKLRRVFGYPYEYSYEEDEPNFYPALVIVGPRNDIIEPRLANMFRGYDANLFTYEKSEKAEGERVWELKLDMLCSPDTVFKRIDGSQVQFSQLAGKRIIFLFEGDYPEYDGAFFRNTLINKYMHMKGTADEFEVIYFPNSKDKNSRRVAYMPWFVSCSVELLRGCSAFLSALGQCCNRYQSSFLLAFGRDGSLVRKAICPQFGDNYFPFYADDVEAEDFELSCSKFCWGYWDTLYKGLLIDSVKQNNFTAGDLLFCVYHYKCWD
ncbi:probable nucleoredoxin 1 isoform X1 [Daucus carota subsp. sativus]|uniref:probable nucleoredoxin 1 isoform X1 n=1 Tax=Daucus carota subsp. sativus TaxID=79200 RepID=UPI0007EF7854|nr:PREDICTED: probable nucleoredoxin 1 isoform X1 [Daucus carota subsp. sativus]